MIVIENEHNTSRTDKKTIHMQNNLPNNRMPISQFEDLTKTFGKVITLLIHGKHLFVEY